MKTKSVLEFSNYFRYKNIDMLRHRADEESKTYVQSVSFQFIVDH